MHEEGMFSGDTENVMRWVTVAGVLMGMTSAVLIAIVLRRGKKSTQTTAARWILLVGLLLLPSATMLAGNVVGFHNTKQSCSQCHTMEPWIADMKDPKSETQAAKHYKNRWINDNQCYTCHSGYGLAGNVRGKMDGLTHVLHYYFTGVPEEIKIKRPFDHKTCLRCHADTVGYLKIDQHVDAEFKPQILSGELSCFECHSGPHPRKTP